MVSGPSSLLEASLFNWHFSLHVGLQSPLAVFAITLCCPVLGGQLSCCWNIPCCLPSLVEVGTLTASNPEAILLLSISSDTGLALRQWHSCLQISSVQWGCHLFLELFPWPEILRADLTSSFVTCGSGENGWGVYTSIMDGSWWYRPCMYSLHHSFT